MSLSYKSKIIHSITLSRLILLLPCLLLSFSKLSYLCSIIIIIAGISDCLDGFLARKWHLTSKFGAVLDHSIDKIFTIGILLVLSLDKMLLIEQIMVILLVLREISALSLRLLLTTNHQFAEGQNSSYLGKLKTVLLFIYLFLAFIPIFEGMLILQILLISSTLLSLVSFGQYLIKFFIIIKNDK